jgi:hypothetical protein
LEGTIINNRWKLIVVTIFTFLAFSFCLFNAQNVFAQTDQVTSKLQEASSAIGQAFNAVLSAEKAGGNTSQLLAKLNTAGEILAEAQNTYNSGTTANVSFMAENARQIAEQVNVDALNLLSKSLIESENNTMFTLIFSVVGAIMFGISLFLIWRRFKRAHLMKVLDMRPEVVENTN